MEKFYRLFVYLLMVTFIVGAVFLLNNKQVYTEELESQTHATAYLESNPSNASFKIGGRVIELLVQEGDVVKKGQVLAKLESSELEAKVAQAQAAVALAEGQVAQAEAALSAAKVKKEQASQVTALTSATIEQQIEQAEAAVKAAEANVNALKNGAREQEKNQAKIQVDAAEKAFEIAEQNLQRLQQLLEEGLVAQADVDKTELAYFEAKANYELAQQQYSLVQNGAREEEIAAAEAQLDQALAALAAAEANKSQITLKKEDVQAAEAAIKQAEAALQTALSGKQQAEAALLEAETYLTYTALIAPEDGVILSQSAQIGELVGAGYPIYTIEQTTTKKWATFYLPETELAGLKVHDQVAIKFLSNGQTFVAEVSSITPAASFATIKATQNLGDKDVRSFAIKVTFDALPETALTGMTLEWMGKVASEDSMTFKDSLSLEDAVRSDSPVITEDGGTDHD